MTTDFANKCNILGKFYSNYENDIDFEDFMEFNDLGLPLAYFVSENLCKESEEGANLISQTWDLFLAELELSDTGFTNLEDVFFAAETQ